MYSRYFEPGIHAVIHFSGKTVHAVQQDFYANAMLISLTSILKFNLKPKFKTKRKTENKDNRVSILNNTYALAQTKKLLLQIYDQFESINKSLEKLIARIQSYIEYSRKGQSNPRKGQKDITGYMIKDINLYRLN